MNGIELTDVVHRIFGADSCMLIAMEAPAMLTAYTFEMGDEQEKTWKLAVDVVRHLEPNLETGSCGYYWRMSLFTPSGLRQFPLEDT